MLPFINPLPIVLTLTAAFGVLFHDTQFDHAAVTALATPVSISDFGNAETAMRLNDNAHTHTERSSVTTSQPVNQPRLLEDKKYIIQKRLASNISGADYQWPSI